MPCCEILDSGPRFALSPFYVLTRKGWLGNPILNKACSRTSSRFVTTMANVSCMVNGMAGQQVRRVPHMHLIDVLGCLPHRWSFVVVHAANS